jgi:hypothetical protein
MTTETTPSQFIRHQAKIRALALVRDFFLHDAEHRTEERLQIIAEFVLNCHGDDAFSAGKKDDN